VQDAFKLFTRLVNIGDAKSLACHPPAPPPAAVARGAGQAGVTEDTVRLSIGIEHVAD